MRGFEQLPRNDYAAIMDHLANVGPLAVAVDASRFGFYFGGVFDNCPYDQNIAINHAVQLVGYGTDETEGEFKISPSGQLFQGTSLLDDVTLR